MAQELLIMYHRPNVAATDKRVTFEAHGFKFQEGVVYEVSELVHEWAKRQKGFFLIESISKKFVDFSA